MVISVRAAIPARVRRAIGSRSGNGLDYEATNRTVAQALAEAGWHSQRTGQPVDADQAATFLGEIRRRLRLLGLTASRHLGQPLRLNDTGRLTAHAALRARALRPRTRPLT